MTNSLKVEKPIRLHIHEYNMALSQQPALDYWRQWPKDHGVWIQSCFNPLGWVWRYNDILYKDKAYQTVEGAIMDAVKHLVQWMGPTSLPIEFEPSLNDKAGLLVWEGKTATAERSTAERKTRPWLAHGSRPASLEDLIQRLREDSGGGQNCSVFDLDIAAELIEKHLNPDVWIAEGGICSALKKDNPPRFPPVTYLATNKEWLEFEGQKYYLPESTALANLRDHAMDLDNAYGIDVKPDIHGDFSQRMAYATSTQVVKSMIKVVAEEGPVGLQTAGLRLVLSTYHTMLCAHRDKAKEPVQQALANLVTAIRSNV